MEVWDRAATKEAANIVAVAKMLITVLANDPVGNVGAQHAMIEALGLLRKMQITMLWRKRLSAAMAKLYMPQSLLHQDPAVCGNMEGQVLCSRALSDTCRL